MPLRKRMSCGFPEPLVIFLAGSTRSGSTVLERELAAAVGGVGVGEVRYAWQRGIAEDNRCSCGADFSACAFWSKVLVSCREDGTPLSESQIPALNSIIRTRRVIQYEHPILLRRWKPFGAIAPVVKNLYRSIARASAGAVIIDSSKDPMYLRLVMATGVHRVLVIHLTRDSRGVAYSWSRRRVRPEVTGRVELMPVLSPRAVAREWNRVNALLEWRKPPHYLRLRYEDFADAPQETLNTVVDCMRGLGWPRGGDIMAFHSVAGNPVRFDSSRSIERDREWESAMPALDRATVTALTAPLLYRYGYPVR